MRGFGLQRPPRWGILALAVLVAGNVAVFTLMATTPEAADPYVPRTTPVSDVSPDPAADAPAPAAESSVPTQPVLAVFGDGYAAGNEQGGRGPGGWPALVAERFGARLELRAASQAGYASLSPDGADYAALVREAPVPEATVTVLFGSRNDSDESLATVEQNALAVVQAAQQSAVDDTLIVIGPAWSSASYPASLVAVRDAVRGAAQTAGAQFVDPIAEGWFFESDTLIAADGVSPTDVGHAYLADRIAPLVAAALPAA